MNEQGNDTEHSEVEVLAMKLGWNPDHDGNSGREFKSAEEFILDTKAMQDTTVKTLRSLQDQNKQMVSSMQHLRETHKRALAVEKQRVDEKIAELQNQKNAAIQDSSVEKVNEIDAKIDAAKKEKSEIDQSIKDPDPPQTQNVQDTAKAEMDRWLNENPWYGDGPDADAEMTRFADAQSKHLEGLEPKRYFEELDKRISEFFPNKKPSQQQTTDTNQPQNTVLPSQRTNSNLKKTYTFNDLSDEQKAHARHFAKMDVMTIDEYVAEAVRIKSIPGMQ